MKSGREFALFLSLELFAIVFAGILFSTLESKLVAGALAGSYFVISGCFMIYRASLWPRKWQSLTWYCLFVHVFVISLPMLIARFLQRGAAFADVRILGIPGPMFHNISSIIFSVLIVATIADYVRSRWAGGAHGESKR